MSCLCFAYIETNAEVKHPQAEPWRHKLHSQKSTEPNLIFCLMEEDSRFSTGRRNPCPPSYLNEEVLLPHTGIPSVTWVTNTLMPCGHPQGPRWCSDMRWQHAYHLGCQMSPGTSPLSPTTEEKGRQKLIVQRKKYWKEPERKEGERQRQTEGRKEGRGPKS